MDFCLLFATFEPRDDMETSNDTAERKIRNRKTSMKVRKDGRYRVSWKDKQYNSKKGESEGDFRARLAALDIFPA